MFARSRVPGLVAVMVAVWTIPVLAVAQEKDVVWAVGQAPADAALVAAVRSVQELETALKAFIGPEGQDIKLVDPLEGRLPPGALDVAGPLVLVVFPRGKDLDLVGLARVKDAAKIAGEEVGPNIIRSRLTCLMQMGAWAAWSDAPEALKALAAAPARMTGLDAQRQAIGSHLIWAMVNPKVLASAAKTGLENELQAAPPGQPGGPPKAALDMVKWVLGLADQVEGATLAADVKAETASLAVDVRLAEGSNLASIASASMPIEAYKGGLPASDRLVAAAWMRLDWNRGLVPFKALVRPLIDIITADADEAARKSIADVWAMYDQYAATMGNDVAISLEPAPPGQGMYRIVETFAVKDPVQYRQLSSKMAAASSDMMKVLMGQFSGGPGGPTMKMDMEYKEAAETVEGLPVDVWRMKIDLQLPPDAPPQAREQMKAMMDAIYGPEGMTIRMAVVDKTAVVAVGDAQTLARAVKALRGQGPDLGSDARVAAALGRLPRGACSGGIVSLTNMIYMVMGLSDRMMTQSVPPEIREAAKQANLPPLEAPAAADFATFAARVSGRTVRFELAVPQADIQGAIAVGKRGAQRMEWFAQQQMEQHKRMLEEREKQKGAPPAPVP